MTFHTFRPASQKQAPKAATTAAETTVKATPRFGFRPGAAPIPVIRDDDIPSFLKPGVEVPPDKKPAIQLGLRRR